MDDDDDLPRNVPKKLKPLDPLSVEELQEYILELESEIVRAKDMIAAKEGSRGVAEDVFKK